MLNQKCLPHLVLAEEVKVCWQARPQNVCLMHSWCKSVCMCIQWLWSHYEAVWWDKIYLTSAKFGKSPNSFFFFFFLPSFEENLYAFWKRGHAHISPDLLGPKFKAFNSSGSACVTGGDILALDPSVPMENGGLYLLNLVKKHCAGYRCFSHTPVLLSSN